MGLLLRNAFGAKLSAQGASTRLQALKLFEKQLKSVSRRLDDARALAWDTDLSDSLGRSQAELRALAVKLENALPGSGPGRVTQGERTVADWPFVAL